MKSVTIYTTDYCPYCRRAEAFLEQQQIPFKQIDVTGNDKMREKLVEMSDGRTTVPQIFVGEKPIGGFTDMMALHRTGEFEALLKD